MLGGYYAAKLICLKQESKEMAFLIPEPDIVQTQREQRVMIHFFVRNNIA